MTFLMFWLHQNLLFSNSYWSKVQIKFSFCHTSYSVSKKKYPIIHFDCFYTVEGSNYFVANLKKIKNLKRVMNSWIIDATKSNKKWQVERPQVPFSMHNIILICTCIGITYQIHILKFNDWQSTGGLKSFEVFPNGQNCLRIGSGLVTLISKCHKDYVS